MASPTDVFLLIKQCGKVWFLYMFVPQQIFF